MLFRSYGRAGDEQAKADLEDVSLHHKSSSASRPTPLEPEGTRTHLGLHVELVVTGERKTVSFESSPPPSSNTQTHRWRLILPSSLYLRSMRRRTRWRRIQRTLVGIRASAVPFLFPGPVWRPLALAASWSLTRAREWMTWGLMMMKPSRLSWRMLRTRNHRQRPVPAPCARPPPSQSDERTSASSWRSRSPRCAKGRGRSFAFRRQGPA